MTCYLPETNEIAQFQIAGYALFGHFGESLGRRVEGILRATWGDGWYQRLFPGAPRHPREDHYDPEAVLRALIGREIVRPPSPEDRTELKRLLFPALADGDLRALRALRGAYAHYEGALATVSEVRGRLGRAAALLVRVATSSWADAGLEKEASALGARVADLEAGRLARDGGWRTAPSTPYEEQLQLAVREMQRLETERKTKRSTRASLRLGDPYPPPQGGRELRLLRSADELWDVEARRPASALFDAASVREATREMRNFLLDPTLYLDEDDMTLSTSLLGTLRFVGQLKAGPSRVGMPFGQPWHPTALLLPRAYRLLQSGEVLSLEDDQLGSSLPISLADDLASGFAVALDHAGSDALSADMRVSLAGDVVVWLGGRLYVVGVVTREQWFEGHFDVAMRGDGGGE